MNIDITILIQALITAMALAVTYFVIPWLKTKLSAERREQVSYWLTVAVEAAEEAARSGKIAKSDKYQYVVNLLEAKGINFDEAETMALINSVVWELINKFKSDELEKVGGSE